MHRKRICVITAHTESLYCQRVLYGIFGRCRMYGYDVAVFAQSAQVCDSYTEYLHGEKNIYGLINYNRFDGVIIIPLQLTEDNRTEIFDEIVHSLRTKCNLPVISLDKPIEGFETVFTDDRSVIKQVANHVIQEHKCSNIYFLSGEQKSPISKDRTYLIRPYTNFYLCLRENWLDTDISITEGYPDKMRTVVHTTPTPNSGFHSLSGEKFDTELMLPFLYEEREKPAVFCFSPVHFNREMLGYAVIQQNIDEYENISLIYRNWLRFVNNALEAARAKNQLSYISMHDAMTGCLNRRGMYQRVNNMLEISDDSLLMSVYVIDMDRLKYVNDVFGHSEGDFCIMGLSYAIRNILKDKEICVRAGGDEFFIIGMGTYSDEEENERIKKLSEFLDSFNANSGRPYTLSASIGRAMGKPTCMEDFNKLLSAADAKMYAVKQEHKQQGER